MSGSATGAPVRLDFTGQWKTRSGSRVRVKCWHEPSASEPGWWEGGYLDGDISKLSWDENGICTQDGLTLMDRIREARS